MLTYRIKSFLLWRSPHSLLEAIHRALNKDNIFTVRYNNKKILFYLPVKRDIIQQYVLIFRRFYEQDELTKLRKYTIPGMTFIDAGANIGNHTLFFSSILHAKKVYSFEPQDIVNCIFEKNMILNGLYLNVELFRCGLGSENTSACICFDGSLHHNIGGTHFRPCERGSFEIRKLDDISIPEKIDFIKIDVEEMENSLLIGAKETITRDKPLIWIEILDHNYDAVSTTLANYGYELKEKLSDYNYLFIPSNG